MTPDILNAIALISTISIFTAAFCPALLWVLTTPLLKRA